MTLFAIDKRKHLLVTALASGLAAVAAFFLRWPMDLCALLAGGTAAVLWEVYQRRTASGTASWADAAAGTAGSALIAFGLAWGEARAVFYVGLAIALIALAVHYRES